VDSSTRKNKELTQKLGMIDFCLLLHEVAKTLRKFQFLLAKGKA